MRRVRFLKSVTVESKTFAKDAEVEAGEIPSPYLPQLLVCGMAEEVHETVKEANLTLEEEIADAS